MIDFGVFEIPGWREYGVQIENSETASKKIIQKNKGDVMV